MAKRFGRPAPAFKDKNADNPMVRQIRLAREGSGMEDVYASISALDEMHAASAESAHKRAVYDGILHWTILIVFWAAVIYAAALFLRGIR